MVPVRPTSGGSSTQGDSASTAFVDHPTRHSHQWLTGQKSLVDVSKSSCFKRRSGRRYPVFEIPGVLSPVDV